MRILMGVILPRRSILVSQISKKIEIALTMVAMTLL